MALRYQGRLKKWNAERGFGFIVADDGGAELFAHISAFARDGQMPTVGDSLSFEVEPDRDGKKRAVRVRRPGQQAASAPTPHLRMSRRSHRDAGSGFFGRLATLGAVCAIAWFAYSGYVKRAASFDSALPAPAALIAPAKLPVPDGFKCDGRSMCSQMTSCAEATQFLQNCPGMQMDGNHDGVPCEQQWCK
jgi:cold shock CspA family protein